MEYKYLDCDNPDEFYDIKNNPEDDNEGNLAIILRKYDYDIYDKELSNSDSRELQRIMMKIYEGTIRSFRRDFNLYLTYLLLYKHAMSKEDQTLRYIANMEYIRHKYDEIFKVSSIIGHDADYILHNKIITEGVIKDMIISICRDMNICMEQRDIDELNIKNILSYDFLKSYLIRYNKNNLDELNREIKLHMTGGII